MLLDLKMKDEVDHLVIRNVSLSMRSSAPSSCDLAPLYYDFCGYVKSLVYENNPETLDVLE